jgi:hypothetical protein
MGLKRGTQPKAARAVRRSADAPKPSKPPRPRKLKPAPPVTDCLKCSKIAAIRRERDAALRLVEKLEAEERTRLQAAAAGIGGCLTDEEIDAAKRRVFHPLFEQVLQVAVNVALSPAEEAGDRLKAVMIVKDEVAGKVADKVKLDAKINGPMYFVPGLPAPVANPAPEGSGA